jgi:hypothetical protein
LQPGWLAQSIVFARVASLLEVVQEEEEEEEEEDIRSTYSFRMLLTSLDSSFPVIVLCINM